MEKKTVGGGTWKAKHLGSGVNGRPAKRLLLFRFFMTDSDCTLPLPFQVVSLVWFASPGKKAGKFTLAAPVGISEVRSCGTGPPQSEDQHGLNLSNPEEKSDGALQGEMREVATRRPPVPMFWWMFKINKQPKTERHCLGHWRLGCGRPCCNLPPQN